MNLDENAENVLLKNDLVVFVNNLRLNLINSPEEWENRTLESFLEAMASWVDDMDGYYINKGETPPAVPTWQTIADILLGAKIYE